MIVICVKASIQYAPRVRTWPCQYAMHTSTYIQQTAVGVMESTCFLCAEQLSTGETSRSQCSPRLVVPVLKDVATQVFECGLTVSLCLLTLLSVSLAFETLKASEAIYVRSFEGGWDPSVSKAS